MSVGSSVKTMLIRSGQHVIVCADGNAGEEVKILLLLEDENGTLAL